MNTSYEKEPEQSLIDVLVAIFVIDSDSDTDTGINAQDGPES